MAAFTWSGILLLAGLISTGLQEPRELALARSVRADVERYLGEQTQRAVAQVTASITRQVIEGLPCGRARPEVVRRTTAILAKLQRSSKAPKDIEVVWYHYRPDTVWAGMRYGHTLFLQIEQIQTYLRRNREDLVAAILAHELGHDARDAVRNLLAEETAVGPEVKAVFRALVEQAADSVAIGILNDAGYAPGALVEHLQTTSQYHRDERINRTYRIEPAVRQVARGASGSR